MDIKPEEKQVFHRGISLISRTVNGGNKEYYYFNVHKDISILSDKYGDALNKYSYDAFETQIQEPNETDNNPFRYCGEYFDWDSCGCLYYDDLYKEYPRLKARWETSPEQPNQKQNYNTFAWDRPSVNSYNSTTTNEHFTMKDEYNKKDQLTKKTITYTDGNKLVQNYTYDDRNPEGVPLVSKLLEYVTLNWVTCSKKTEKTFNKYHQPLTIKEADREVINTYNDYGLPVEQKQKQNYGVYIGTKNTYSEDGKKVIKTENFQQTGNTYSYFETTDFEYNQYGEVTKTIAHNEPQANVVTDILYNYAPEEDGFLYTKTTTVNNVEHIDGLASVSTVEKYDNLGNLVYQMDGNHHIQNALIYIHRNFRNSLSLNEIAEYTHVSPNYLSKIFHQTMGITYKNYYNNLRMQFAKKLLLNSQLSITEICYEIGYGSLANFTKEF